MKIMPGKKQPTDPMTRDALKALREAVAEVIEKARRDGRKIAIWRNGKAVMISPDELDKEKDDEKRASKRDTVSPEFKRYQKMMKPTPQQPKDPMTRKALMALREAVAEVYEKARREGRPLAVWQDGKAVLVYPGRTVLYMNRNPNIRYGQLRRGEERNERSLNRSRSVASSPR